MCGDGLADSGYSELDGSNTKFYLGARKRSISQIFG